MDMRNNTDLCNTETNYKHNKSCVVVNTRQNNIYDQVVFYGHEMHTYYRYYIYIYIYTHYILYTYVCTS